MVSVGGQVGTVKIQGVGEGIVVNVDVIVGVGVGSGSNGISIDEQTAIKVKAAVTMAAVINHRLR